ncbi:rRNA biogenesis protein rrp5 [Lecanora helva]
MAPVKRKAEAEVKNARPEKRPKPPSTIQLSNLKEEPAFPRGGASVLTPLEHKQIQVQAKQDVLFEQRTGKKVTNEEFDDGENDENIPEEAHLPSVKTKRKSKSKDRKKLDNSASEELGVRIQGLSYKRLVPGSMVLGQVSQINRHDLALSLPNNLTGYVPLTAISEKFNKQLESLTTEEDGMEEDGTSHEHIDIEALVSVGQYLRALVTSTQQEEGVSGKRHIELSINPRDANSGLSNKDIVINSLIQASVLSIEDHGLIMDLGLEEKGMRGFMSSKELGSNGDIAKVAEGSVYLCLVTGKASNGNVIKLSADPSKIGAIKKGSYVTDAPTVDSFLPGTAIEFLVSEVTPSGLAGKVMGMLTVTADLIHSGAASSGKDLEKKYTTGTKIKGRIICTFPNLEEKKLGISLQEHITYWKTKTTASTNVIENLLPTKQLPISSIVEQATIVKVQPRSGLLLDLGVKGVRGFVHISKVSDGKIETLAETTGPYKIGSQHRARIIGYNSVDGLFIVSMQPKIIDQPFLHVEDVVVGQIVHGTIEKMMVNASGFNGVLVNLAEGISGLVPEVHLADVHLQHPEKKFKEGNKVTARVLSTDLRKKQIRLTLKKTLINSDVPPWLSYIDLKPGMQAPGTLINVNSAGAVVQFYGPVRAFLPVSEMSESFIQNPEQHFRNGQVVNVHVVSVNAEDARMIVSCKDPSIFGAEQQEAFRNLGLGASVVGTVIEKTNDEIVVQLEPAALKATLSLGHLTDGSAQKSHSAAKRIRVGQVLKDIVVLSKQESKHLIRLTSKPSLIKAEREGKLLKVFEDVVEESEVCGFVRNITPTGVFVGFAGDLTALLLKQHLSEEVMQLPEYGLERNQSVTARVLSIDYSQKRFLLTQKPPTSEVEGQPKTAETDIPYDRGLSNPVDGVSSSIDDFTLGKQTKARITSVKNTQLNVLLADGVQGRIDISEVFDKWEEVKDRKHPLKKFHTKQVLPVRILGIHDSRNHRFLPITHRSKAPVFELTAKPNNQTFTDLDILTFDKVEVGSTWLTFINNISDDYVWVNLSPNVRGRIRTIDLSDNVSKLKDLAKNFPVGSAVRAKVLKVDLENHRLDLSARSGSSSGPATLDDIIVGSIIPGRVTKVTERQVMVQLSETLSAPIHLVDLADDYSTAHPTAYQKNQIVRVCIKNVDVSNKKITLSARPSKVLSSSLPVKDPDIGSSSDLKVNDVVRGFIKHVADSGIFVSLASNVTAFVRISDLSDEFLKDWKSGFEIDQLVEGKIISVDPALNHIQMSLKRSRLDKNYIPPLVFSDIRKGRIVTGKVRKVEDFGVFVVVDNSANVSGLCHRSKISDKAGANPKKLYEEGDVVQAKVLSIDEKKKQISLGLKASYFASKNDSQDPESQNPFDINGNAVSDSDEETQGVDLDEGNRSEDESADGDEEIQPDFNDEDILDMDDDEVEIDGQEPQGVQLLPSEDPAVDSSRNIQKLSAGKFDWNANLTELDNAAVQSDTDVESTRPRNKKRRKAEIKVDMTGDLDAHGPQSTADFERLLMGDPNSSDLWREYMKFYLQLNEISTARAIAERALKTIHIQHQPEKLDIWFAMLYLENIFGDDATLDEVFKRACQYNDSLEIHSQLARIYIQSQKYEKADSHFQATLKKHTQSPDLYINYATFLMDQLDSSDRARSLLSRALQALPQYTHLALTSKFAQLEFTTRHGSPERGRTVFEKLLSQWPRRLDLWNVLLDMEIKIGDKDLIRRLFERVTGQGMNLKPEKAKHFFKKWLGWEMKSGDVRSQERVKALTAEYVRNQERERHIE